MGSFFTKVITIGKYPGGNKKNNKNLLSLRTSNRMRKIKIMVMKKIVSRVRDMFTRSSRFVAKALVGGIVFSVGVVLVFAFSGSLDTKIKDDKALKQRLSIGDWNSTAAKVNDLWGRVATVEGNVDTLEGNQLPVCTSGQVIKSTGSGWECGEDLMGGSGGGDDRLVEICNITTCEGDPGTDEYVVVGTQTWSCCNSSLGSGVPVGDAYNGKFYSVGDIFEACTGEWEVPTRDDFVTLDGDINRMALPKLGVRADNGVYWSHDVSYLWTSTFQDVGANNGDRVSYAKNGTVDKTIPGEMVGMSYHPLRLLSSTVPESAGYQFHIRCIKK